MFSSIVYFLLLYLLANALVLLGQDLIDFGFSLWVALLCTCLSLLVYLRKPMVRFEVLSKTLMAIAFFFFTMAWVSAFVLWHIDQRLDESLEGKVLLVEGQVHGLPEQESKRQVFDFFAQQYWQCDEASLGDCQKLSMQNRPMPERLFSLELSELLWVYFFRNETLSAMPRKIRVALYQYSKDNNVSVQAGENYQLLLKLRRPRSSLNFVGFDYETWLFTQGLHANAYVKNNGINSVEVASKNFSGKISSLRDSLRNSLINKSSKTNNQDQGSDKNPAEVSQALALILALSIGDRSYLNVENKKLLIETGTAHLLAISGMHIALMSALAFFIAFNLTRSLNWLLSFLGNVSTANQKVTSQLKIINFSYLTYMSSTFSPLKVAALNSLVFASIYALLAGFSLPTQRALIMVVCYSLGLIFYQRVNFYKLWFFTMLLVLIRDPFALMSSGFYLSFIAVFIIQWVLLGHYFQNGQHFFRKLLNLLRAQWAVFLGLMPLTMLFFSGFFPVALLCNLFAVPLVSFITLPLSLLATFLLLFNNSVNMDLFFIDSLITYSLYLSELSIEGLLGSLSAVINFFPKNQPVTLSVISAASVFIFIILMLSPLPLRLKLLSTIFFLPTLLHNDQPVEIPNNEIRVEFFDVGQGLALMIETKNHILLYDTGPSFGDNFDAGSAIILPALRAKNHFFKESKIDILMLSHGDNDHVGGVKSILSALNPSQIIAYPKELYDKKEQNFLNGESWQTCEAGQFWQWDGVRFLILYPDKNALNTLEKSNNLSCVLLIQARNFSILLTGDIEKQAEQYLLESLLVEQGEESLLKTDVLVAAHHGSKTSSTREFLEAAKPGLVLVSAGFKNQFGHPHKDVIKRYQAIDAQVLLSAETGALLIESWRFNAEKPLENILKAREQRHRYWRF